jgi:hypothetical protein
MASPIFIKTTSLSRLNYNSRGHKNLTLIIPCSAFPVIFSSCGLWIDFPWCKANFKRLLKFFQSQALKVLASYLGSLGALRTTAIGQEDNKF